MLTDDVTLLLPHLGNHLEAQICQRSDEAPYILKSACHFCYFKTTSIIDITQLLCSHKLYRDNVKKTKNNISVTPSLGHGWLLQENPPGWFPWEKGRTQRCPRRHCRAAPSCRESMCLIFSQSHGWIGGQKINPLTLAMSQTVTNSQTAARSKLCTLFFTLRAILQSPQPKSATTREGGLEKVIQCAFTTNYTGIHQLSNRKAWAGGNYYAYSLLYCWPFSWFIN